MSRSTVHKVHILILQIKVVKTVHKDLAANIMPIFNTLINLKKKTYHISQTVV